MSKRDRLIVIGSAALISLALLFGRLPSGLATFTPPTACTATSGSIISSASWNTCIAALAAAINSIDNSKVSAGAGIVGSKLDLTNGTGKITSATGTLTVDGTSGFSVTQTWNNVAATFNAALIDITDTTSSGLSKGFVVRVNGTDILAVDKVGRASFNAGVFTGSQGYSFPDGTTQTTASTTMPAGTVAFFNLGSCPTGWTEYTDLRGKYVVGLPSGGSLADGAGTALTDKENRAAGAHTHTVYAKASPSTGDGSYSGIKASTDTGDVASGAVTGGATAGTNAPYHQLLACTKS